MKWGVRKKASQVKSSVKSRVDSIKREHSWKKKLNDAGNMSTKDLQRTANRAQLENDMKRLSKKSNVGSSKDKKDYLKRADMSDQELFRKVQRLRAKDQLNRNADEATKKQREIAKKVVQVAAPLVIQYAMTRTISKKDIMNAVVNSGGAKVKMVKTVMDTANKAKNNTKHGDDLEDVLLHSLEVEFENETWLDDLLEDFSDDEIAEMLSHNIGDSEDTLQHFGVKGMKWGVRKGQVKGAIKKYAKNRREKANKKVLDYHEKNKENKTYKKLYESSSKRYKTHLGAATNAARRHGEIKRARVQLGVHAAVLASPVVSKALRTTVKAAHKVATNPDNIRKAKNVVQAMKRSPIRYVDGKKMTNVVKTVF